MTKIAIVYYSGFKGVTEKIAQAVARGARQVPETEVITIHTDSVDNHWQDLGEADAIIFGTPTYIGGPAAKFKEFIENLPGISGYRDCGSTKYRVGLPYQPVEVATNKAACNNWPLTPPRWECSGCQFELLEATTHHKAARTI